MYFPDVARDITRQVEVGQCRHVAQNHGLDVGLVAADKEVVLQLYYGTGD